MWKNIQRAAWVLLLLTVVGTAEAQSEQRLRLHEKSILVYGSIINGENTQFVIRIARFLPDRVFEWETTAFQGTVHLHKAAVEEAETLTYGMLFEAGVGFESSDTITKWLSSKMFSELSRGKPVKYRLNNVKAEFILDGREIYKVLLDGKELEIPAIRIKDSRKGVWLFQDDPGNPLLLRYVSPYFREELKRVSNSEDNQLRWIKKLPAVN
jgi:hypothetical protein